MPGADGRPTLVSLFAGVGGFDLGAEAEGWRVRHAVEFDEQCRSLIRKHFPDVQNQSRNQSSSVRA